MFGGDDWTTAPEELGLAEDWETMLAVLDAPVDQHRITVSSMKGGVSKTTTVLGLGTALALHRRDAVTSLDANPHRGTLAERLGVEHRRSIRDLLTNLRTIHTASDLRRFTSVARSRLEVLAATQTVEKQAVTPQEYAAALTVMLTFRSVVLTDTGTDLLLPLMNEVYASTDSLVVPTTTADDGWRLALETLAWWEQRAPNGRRLVAEAVVPLVRLQTFTVADPAHPPRGRELRRLIEEFEIEQEQREAEVRRLLEPRVRAVVPVPHDPALRAGGPFLWDSLQPATQDAYINVAYEVAKGFRPPRG